MKTDLAQTMSPIEAGRLLGIGRGVVYRLIREGTIPSLHLGKKYRVPRIALEELLRNPGRLKEAL